MDNIIKLPGLIDIHVHFRDPGEAYKEDFHTGSVSALSGGVTTVFDMPNNKAPILTYKLLKEKIKKVKSKAVSSWGLYFGTDGKNLEQFETVKDIVVGLKVYLNVTTGDLIIEDEELVEKIFFSWPKDKVIVAHAQRNKIGLAIKLAKRYGNKIHITHVATGRDLDKILSAKGEGVKLTCDVTPHHLLLTKNRAELLSGSGRMHSPGVGQSVAFYQVKPPLATKEDQQYLWQNIDNIDCVASDHAPHTIEEKKSANPPSGLPGVETTLPLLLTAAKRKQLTIGDIVRLMNTNPQKIFNFQLNSDTYIEVDLTEKYRIDNGSLFTKCGWSPFEGWEVYGKVKRVYIRGEKVFEDDKVLVKPGFGKNILNT